MFCPLKFKSAYKNQKDDDDKKEFKKIINYCGDVNKKHKILNHLLKIFNIDQNVPFLDKFKFKKPAPATSISEKSPIFSSKVFFIFLAKLILFNLFNFPKTKQIFVEKS